MYRDCRVTQKAVRKCYPKQPVRNCYTCASGTYSCKYRAKYGFLQNLGFGDSRKIVQTMGSINSSNCNQQLFAFFNIKIWLQNRSNHNHIYKSFSKKKFKTNRFYMLDKRKQQEVVFLLVRIRPPAEIQSGTQTAHDRVELAGSSNNTGRQRGAMYLPTCRAGSAPPAIMVQSSTQKGRIRLQYYCPHGHTF